jgi:Xaa-Pro aminopeptidase
VTGPAFDFAARLARTRAFMADQGIDVLLASVGSDLPYLTGYRAMPSERLTMVVVPQGGRPTLVVPALEAPRVVAQPDVFDLRPWSETDDPVALVARLAGAPARVALTDQTWAVFLLALQQALPRTEFISAQPLSAALRLRKDAEEIELMRAAAAAVDRVAARLAGHRFSGSTERELSRLVAAMTVEEGCDVSMFAIVASGPNAASPHHEPTDRLIAGGDAVVVDFGGSVGGYQSDTTRTFHVGEPAAEYREVHEVVRAAQSAGVEAARAGVAAEAVDAAARRVIDDAGYGEWFIHRLGHGIGLDVHEDPYLVEGNTEVLEAGMAFSVEPGIYLPGRLGVRIEDIVVCTPDGPERLNRSSRRLVVVD